MPIYYKRKFTLTLKASAQCDFFDEITDIVQKWLLKKYPDIVKSAILPIWADVIRGTQIGNVSRSSDLCLESIFVEDADSQSSCCWACKITEPIKNEKSNSIFESSRWVSEIGCRRTSTTEANVFFEVSYLNSNLNGKKISSQITPNTPGIAKKIMSSSSWTYMAQLLPESEMFGVDACAEMAATIAKARLSEEYPIDKRWISLCKINRPDKNDHIWMIRIADADAGELVVPSFDEKNEQIFDNRRFIFHTDGPTEPDILGFWEWNEYQTDSGAWYSETSFIEDTTPIELVILESFTDVREIVSVLKTGLKFPSYVRNNVIIAIQDGHIIKGILCDIADLCRTRSDDRIFRLKENTYTLPYYEIAENDFISWKNRKIYKYVTLSKPMRLMPTSELSEHVRKLLLQRMTWPIFKANGISKNEWQKIKDVIAAIPSEGLIEQLSQLCGIPSQDAEQCVEDFIENVHAYLNLEDIDTRFTVQLFNAYEPLREQFYTVAKQKWLEEHAHDVKAAEAELAAIRDQATHETTKAKAQLHAIEEKTAGSIEAHEDVLRKIEEATQELSNVRSEIERYKMIGEETVATVKQKIQSAQTDIAGFISDISMFLPMFTSTSLASTQYIEAPAEEYSSEDTDMAETWNDELDNLSSNLHNALGVETELSRMLAAYLYSVHLHNVPLLIAGPGGADIADLLSKSIYSIGSSKLLLNGDGSQAASEIKLHKEPVVSVHNMFGTGWSDTLPASYGAINKQIVWCHPFTEDMSIEPKGLYNYMLPLLSESFISTLPATDICPVKRSEGFHPYKCKTTKSLSLPAFKKLGMSKYFIQKLSAVLTDAKALLDNPSASKDMEVLFGLLPLCVLTGRQDVLKDIWEDESGISKTVKAEIERYIENE